MKAHILSPFEWINLLNPSSPKGMQQPLKQFSPRCSKTRSQGVILLPVLLRPSFPLILAGKNEQNTTPGGRVSFQSWEVEGGWCNPVILKLVYFENLLVIFTLNFVCKLKSSFSNTFSKNRMKIPRFNDFLRKNQFLPIFYTQHDNQFSRAWSHYDIIVRSYINGWYIFWYQWMERGCPYIYIGGKRVISWSSLLQQPLLCEICLGKKNRSGELGLKLVINPISVSANYT